MGGRHWQEIAVMSLYRGPRRAFADRRNEPLQINWRRGLFRVWLLLSAAWMMAWAIYLVMSAIRDGMQTAGDLLVIPVMLFGPPLALLAFGVAAGWAFRGFKTGDGTADSQPEG
jgi:hypothetical protein